MKRLIASCIILSAALVSHAQALQPVSWNFSAKKISDKTYEIHFTANIQHGWHLYSQTQPNDAIAIPTAFVINKNPLIHFDGSIREVGKMEKFKDETLGLSANQYSGKVDFVQVVKLKVPARTNISGTVEFQTCDDKKCLPPKKLNFTVVLNNG